MAGPVRKTGSSIYMWIETPTFRSLVINRYLLLRKYQATAAAFAALSFLQGDLCQRVLYNRREMAYFNCFLYKFYYETTLTCTCIAKITVYLRICRLRNPIIPFGSAFMTVWNSLETIVELVSSSPEISVSPTWRIHYLRASLSVDGRSKKRVKSLIHIEQFCKHISTYFALSNWLKSWPGPTRPTDRRQ